MADWDDVARIASALPEVTENQIHEMRCWRVRDALFVWERPLRRSDLEELGDSAPDSPILAARVPGEEVKAALISSEPEIYFTTPHFDGYPAVLVCLPRIGTDELEELITEAWLSRAPKRLVKQWEADRRGKA